MDETADEREPLLILRPDLVAHGEWLARGRQGEGQLHASGVRLELDLRSADLRHADFEGCDFRKVDLRGARLDAARFRDCLFEGADLRQASAIDARFEDCDLRRAAMADLAIGPTGFLRCRFGDFATQPVGRPAVKGPYVVLAPDTSAHGDASRVGTAADIDLRWFSAPKDAVERRFEIADQDGHRTGVRVLHMHLHWYHDTGLRFREQTADQTFAHFLASGPPLAFAGALPHDAVERLHHTVERLSISWTPPE
jgi:hypothetical protein